MMEKRTREYSDHESAKAVDDHSGKNASVPLVAVRIVPVPEEHSYPAVMGACSRPAKKVVDSAEILAS
jgi:hypothetical protein